MERRVVHSVRTATLLLTLSLVAGCSAHASSVSTSTHATTTAHAEVSRVPPPTSTTTTTTATAGPSVSVALSGLPASIRRGSGPVGFQIVLTNDGGADAVGIAPLFQLVGPPCNCLAGTLERRDPTTGIWSPAPLPEGDGYNPLERAAGPVTIPAHASVTVDERITVSAANNPKAASAMAVAVRLADHAQVGATATVPVEITR